VIVPSFLDIERAAERLSGFAVETPILESERLNEQLGGRLLLKPECLQRTGSFKFRGAFNKISKLAGSKRANGVVAFSSGNHAQGVAAAARILGVKAIIVMPSDAPAVKIENTKADGAEVVLYERKDGNRVAIAEKIVADTGAVMIPPYDDPDIMAGQGTIGLEFAKQAGDLDAKLDILAGPCSGGGMIGGCALAFETLSPHTQIYSVEPEYYDDTARSLAAGKRMEISPDRNSICDALLLEIPGKLTFEINRKLLEGGLSVTDRATEQAMLTAFQEFKIVLEPGGAVALAAILEEKLSIEGKTAGVIGTGGNVDPETFRHAISQIK